MATTIVVLTSADPLVGAVGQVIDVGMVAANDTDKTQKTTMYLIVEKPDQTTVTIASISSPVPLHSSESIELSGAYVPDVTGHYTVWGVAFSKTIYSRGSTELDIQ